MFTTTWIHQGETITLTTDTLTEGEHRALAEAWKRKYPED